MRDGKQWNLPFCVFCGCYISFTPGATKGDLKVNCDLKIRQLLKISKKIKNQASQKNFRRQIFFSKKTTTD